MAGKYVPPPASPVNQEDYLSKLVSGNQNLIARPGLVQALASGNATPSQASTINSFMSGLAAQHAVEQARTSEAKINIDASDQVALRTMGVKYDDVLLTPAAIQAQQAAATAAANAPAVAAAATAKAAADAQKAKSKNDGWLSSFGSFGHHLLHNPAINGVGEAYNATASVAGDAAQRLSQIPAGIAGNASADTSSNHVVQPDVVGLAKAQDADLMRSLGYDPNNPLSVIAFRGKGYSHSDTSDLADKWDTDSQGVFGWTGTQAVTEAEVANADPEKWEKELIGSTTMSNDQKAALIQSPVFQDLRREVAGRGNTVGNQTAASIGLDPVKNSKAFALTSAATDVAVSFLLDPTLAAGKVVGAVKVARIGLDSLSDSEQVARALTNPAVVRGWTSAMSDADKMSKGIEAGTVDGKIQAAAALAHYRATTPQLLDMLPTLQGHAINYALDAGKVEIAPIRTMAALTDHLTSMNGLLRLSSGRSMVETGLMPGALSRFGFRQIKGAAAAGLTGRSAAKNAVRDINIARDARRLQVFGDDAVDAATGLPINPTPATNIPGEAQQAASAARGAVTDAQKGTATFNLRRTGDIGNDAATMANWISPAAVAARLRLSATRLSSFLPRNLTVEHGAGESTEKVYRFGLQFLNRGDSALFAAQFAHGDEGVQAAVMDGIVEQTGHAAGLGATDTGRAYLATLKDRLNGNSYGHSGTSSIVDPISGKTRDVAVHPSEVRDTTFLPSFKQLNTDAARIGIWRTTVGRALSAPITDTLGDYSRMAMLFKPNIALRNIIEGQGNIAVRGHFMKLLQSKTMLRDADISTGGLVQTQRNKVIQKAINLTGLDHVGQVYRYFMNKTISAEDLKHFEAFAKNNPDEWRATILGIGEHQVGRGVDTMGVGDTSEIFGTGFAAKRVTRVGYGMADTTGPTGAARYADALGTKFTKYPAYTKALFKAVEDPNHDLTDVIAELKKIPATSKMVRGGVYTDADGVSHVAASASQKELALEQQAQEAMLDAKYLLTNQNGDHMQEVADHIVKTGTAPSAAWVLAHLKDSASRPAAVLAPEFRAIAQNGVHGFLRTVLDASGVGYKAMVENPIKRTTTEPAYMMNYLRHMKTLAPVEKDLIAKGGLDEQAAFRVTHDIAVKRAYAATEEMIDDPGLKTQADIVGRNFFMFTRAIQAFARRWGGLAVTNPSVFRKVFLATEGMQHAGLVYTDPNGAVNFTYPGSDLMMNAMTKMESLIPGLGGRTMYPIHGGLTGQLNMIAPGIENPARISASPMINTPFHALEKLMPQYQNQMDQIDRLVNGSDAQGQGMFKTFVPGAITKFTNATVGDDRNSAFASAMVGAISNLQAADPDGTKGIFPKPGASASERDAFLKKLGVQVQNQLYLRAAFGEFAPAPPGIPGEETDASEKVDPAFSARGVRNLSDEYKMMLNDFNGDRAAATQLFITNHPERLVYTIPASQSTTNKAYLPPTTKADNWIQGSNGFIDNYKSVAAYFVPQDDGAFDLHAYRSEIETGMRQKLTPTEFYTKFRVITAEDQYYTAMDQRDAAVNAALLRGDKTGAANIKANWATWSTAFSAVNPLFKEKQDSYPERTAQAIDAVNDLSRIVKAGGKGLPSNVKGMTPQLSQMVNAYNAHVAWNQANKGEKTIDKLRNDAETQNYGKYMSNIANQNPNLASVYNGVFRAIDSGLPALTPNGG